MIQIKMKKCVYILILFCSYSLKAQFKEKETERNSLNIQSNFMLISDSSKTDLKKNLDFNIGIREEIVILFNEKIRNKNDIVPTKGFYYYLLNLALFSEILHENQYSLRISLGIVPSVIPSETVDFGGYEIGLFLKKYFKDTKFNIFIGFIFHKNWGDIRTLGNNSEYDGKNHNDDNWHNLLGIGGGIKINQNASFDLGLYLPFENQYGNTARLKTEGIGFYFVPSKIYMFMKLGANITF
jgi:hypothetical protein